MRPNTAQISKLLATAALCFFAIFQAAWAQSASPSRPSADAQATMDALSRANAAVVGVRVSVAEGARSAETLGYLFGGLLQRHDPRIAPAFDRRRN